MILEKKKILYCIVLSIFCFWVVLTNLIHHSSASVSSALTKGELKVILNAYPQITVPDSQTVKEGDFLTFVVTATDPDLGDILTLTAFTEGTDSLPTGVSFDQERIDPGSFTEIKGNPGMDLSNYKLIGVDGETGNAYSSVSLRNQIPSDSFFVIAYDDATVPNYDILSLGVNWQNADGAGDNVILMTDGGDTIDAVGYGPSDTSGWFFVGEVSPTLDVSCGHSLGRCPDGVDTDTNNADFADLTTPTPGSSNSCAKGFLLGSDSLVINEIYYDTPEHYDQGIFKWTPNYNQAGEYTIVFVVADNGSPQLTDTGKVVITVEESEPDTLIAGNASGEAGQKSISIPVYISNPAHAIAAMDMRFSLSANNVFAFQEVDTTNSCAAHFLTFNSQISANSVSILWAKDTICIPDPPDTCIPNAPLYPSSQRRLLVKLIGDVLTCSMDTTIFVNISAFSNFSDTTGYYLYYPEVINGSFKAINPPDTVLVAYSSAPPGSTGVNIPILIVNPRHPLINYHIKVSIDGSGLVKFTGVDTTGSCISYFNNFSYEISSPDSVSVSITGSEDDTNLALSTSSERRLFFNLVAKVDSSGPDTTLLVDICPPPSGCYLGDTLYCFYYGQFVDGWFRIGLQLFIRGDANADSSVSISDVVHIARVMFDPTYADYGVYLCESSFDANDDGAASITDIVHLARVMFDPSYPQYGVYYPPYPDCGIDPTPDELTCVSFPPCEASKGFVTYVSPVSVTGAKDKVVIGEAEVSGGSLVVPVDLTTVAPVAGFSYTIKYDPTLLTVKYVNTGLEFDFFSPAIDNETGEVRVGNIPSWRMEEMLSAGNHRVAEITFEVKKGLKEDIPLELTDVELVSGLPSGGCLPCEWVKGVIKAGAGLPTEFALKQNYPNPFNPTTLIKYDLPVDCQVRLEVYNVVGQRAATLVDGQQKAGYKAVTWNARDIASGVYFYKVTAGDFTSIKKMVLLK